MLIDYFPALGLRLKTPRLELRLPTEAELAELAALAARGVHDPGTMPFCVPWTDLPPDELARSVLQFHWRCRGSQTPGDWSLPFAVFLDGVVVGQQDVNARNFAALREVSTGSWLGLRHQGQGIGTEMRAAVLHLAFAGLDAVEATSGAFAHNAASLAVSRRLGYLPDGVDRRVVRDEVTLNCRLRLTRQRWEQHRTVEVTIEGLAACRRQLDAADEPAQPTCG